MSSPEAETDGALAARSTAGDDAAFAMLMSRHKHRAYQFIRRYVGNGADAYDVLQDTFFAAWRALPRYQGDRPFEFWLLRIALNKCRDRGRRGVARRLIGGRAGGDEVAEIPDPAPGPAAVVEANEELQQLQRHLRALPRTLQEPLWLTALEGLSHEAAGQILGISAKAVETKVYRARTRLAKLYARKSADSV